MSMDKVAENNEEPTNIEELPKKKTPLILASEAFNAEFTALCEKHNVRCLAATSFREFNQTGMYYAGETDLLFQLGLAKVIEQRFIQ